MMSSIPTSAAVGPPLPINTDFPNLLRVHASPDIYVIREFLDPKACRDMIEQATNSGAMAQSPTAYAGWTQDVKDLAELAAKGPVVWLALLSAWYQIQQRGDNESMEAQIALVQTALRNYVIGMVLALAGIAAFTKSRMDGLQSLRTSTSTTLDDLSDEKGGLKIFVEQSAKLLSPSSSISLRQEARYFEAPTVIRYEEGQLLAPHYDANRSAEQEDSNRGGQTLATLLVYLNDVPDGGSTRFGKLDLEVQPKQGDALLFFPADAAGNFDDRTEHEGCPAVDEKWIARIWRHQARVPPPFGLSESMLSLL